MAQLLKNRGIEFSNLEPITLQLIEDINALILKKPRSYISICEKLCEFKKLIGHGNFQTHLEKYILGVRSSRSCEIWMKGYLKLAEASKILKTEDSMNFRELSINYDALELLGREATLEHCMQVLEFAHKGENITRKKLNKIIFDIKWVNEKQIQEAIERKLISEGISLLSRGCQAGQADIVTSDAVYEVKHLLTKENIFKAIGQVLLYRECINPSANAIIVGIDGGIKSLIPSINQLGVKVELIK
jgi:hypothetical protein